MAQGVYGGVLYYPGNGDPNDESIINATALRGVQPTDADGIALFDTLVPGHYAGRATHVHGKPLPSFLSPSELLLTSLPKPWSTTTSPKKPTAP